MKTLIHLVNLGFYYLDNDIVLSNYYSTSMLFYTSCTVFYL